MILMGIDPGSRKCGYGILHIDKYKIIAAGSGIIELSPKLSLEEKLCTINIELKKLFSLYKPDFSAVEAIFYGKNIQTAFTLGHIRGLILFTLKEQNIPIFSYSPREIKQSVTGRGNASKHQIEFVVQSILKLSTPPKDDAADGLACALCLYNKEKFNLNSLNS